METYEALAELQKSDPRLRIHAISTATDVNMDEIRRLDHLPVRALPQDGPSQPGHDPGRPQEPGAQRPTVARSTRSSTITSAGSGRAGRAVATARPSSRCCNGPRSGRRTAQAQVVPCRAGILTGVVYSNGDVSFCESHEPLGNLREQAVPGALAFGSGRSRCGARSGPGSAPAPTRSSSGRASCISRCT